MAFVLFFPKKQVAEVRNTCTLLSLVFTRNATCSCCDFFLMFTLISSQMVKGGTLFPLLSLLEAVYLPKPRVQIVSR